MHQFRIHSARYIRLLIIAAVLIAFSSTSATAGSPQKKTPTVADVMATIAPDPLPRKAHNEAYVHIAQPNLFPKKAAANFVIDHNNRNREGIDVSHYQGRIDWQRVAKDGGVCYAYIKATEGADLVDNMHTINLAAARKAGLKVGSYHFYRPRASAEQQFLNMTSVVKKSGQDLVPIIDIEDDRAVSEEKFIADLRNFLNRVTKHYGKRPLLYTGQNFYNKHFQGVFQDYQWMIAKYQDEAPILLDNHPYSFWQYTAKGRVAGVNGNVDRSCLIGNATLQSLYLH